MLAGVQIRLRIDEREPPVGEASVAGGHTEGFVGWLGLLRALSLLLSQPTEPRARRTPRARSEKRDRA